MAGIKLNGVCCSRAANDQAHLRNQGGSNIFAEPDALQTREVNQRKLQVCITAQTAAVRPFLLTACLLFA